MAEVSVGIIATRAVRTSCSLIRLGLTVSGKIDRWDALRSKVIGVGAGLSAGELIDWINSFPIGSNIYDWTHPSDSVASAFNAAQNWTPRRDPLTLDLDGDGLETVAPSSTNPILFDHDGDGVKNGTGWVKSDDGFLVLDRDGNGTVYSGRELFGDSTPLAAGGNAANGFAALAQEDTNFDGEVDTNDANFSRLRVWRDLNQDGLSQSDELSTLDSLNIAALNVTSTTLPSGIKTKRYLGWPDPCALA